MISLAFSYFSHNVIRGILAPLEGRIRNLLLYSKHNWVGKQGLGNRLLH